MLLEASSSSLRPDYETTKSTSGAATDIVIIRMRTNGEILGGHNINMHDSGISIQLAQNSLFTIDGNYIFGAFTYGFKTRYQQIIIGAEDTYQTDSHLFKYNPSSESKCFYQSTLSSVPTTKYTGTQVSDIQYDRYLFKKINSLSAYFAEDGYAASFDLKKTIKTPRMCAQESVHLPNAASYYLNGIPV